MVKLEIVPQWLTVGNDAPEYRDTMAMLELRAGDVSLARNEDIWSQTIRDTVLVSTYPLAMWAAFSWWRLMWEPLPAAGIKSATDWRMAHELAAANHGFVWPRIMFASDGEVM